MNKLAEIFFGLLIVILTSLMGWSLLITHKLAVNQAVLIENSQTNKVHIEKQEIHINQLDKRVTIIECNVD